LWCNRPFSESKTILKVQKSFLIFRARGRERLASTEHRITNNYSDFVETCIFKKRRSKLTGGDSPLPALSQTGYSWAGSNWGGFRKISEIWRLFPIPTGVATPAERNPYWNNLTFEIDLRRVSHENRHDAEGPQAYKMKMPVTFSY
jgi:hypothetical protein